MQGEAAPGLGAQLWVPRDKDNEVQVSQQKMDSTSDLPGAGRNGEGHLSGAWALTWVKL